MTAVVVVCAFNCPDALVECLASISAQDYRDLRVFVVDDASSDPRQPAVVAEWGQRNGWTGVLNTERVGATANIWAALQLAAPDDEDVVILVDGDDRLPHAGCVSRIMAAYDDSDVWLTYGSYESSPYDPNCPATGPYPDDVVRERSFRQWSTLFNHPVTARGVLWRHLDESDLRLASGEWVPMCYDEGYCYPLLELAGPNHRFLDEVLYSYNSANDLSCNVDEGNRQIMIAAGNELRARPKKPRLYREPDGFVLAHENRELVALKYMTGADLSWVVDTTGYLDTHVLTWDERTERVVVIEQDLRRYIDGIPGMAADARVLPVYGDPTDIVRLIGASMPASVWWLAASGASLDMLYLILARGERDVVLIDDARLFGRPGFPTAEEVTAQLGNMAAASGVAYRVEVAYDVVRITPEEN